MGPVGVKRNEAPAKVLGTVAGLLTIWTGCFDGLRAGRGFVVIHPLNDAPEVKRSADQLGPLKLTPGCRIALIAVRAYLVAIMLMGGYRMVTLVSAIRH